MAEMNGTKPELSNEPDPAPAFEVKRDRDAWATIRGYVYQVDLTIERWLGLRREQALELERGEDIDLVQKVLAGTDEDKKRLLEQTKHRDDNLTLRSPEAVEALASFREHQEANPELNLILRYSTNAEAGVERPSPIAGRTPAITAWQKLRADELNEKDKRAALRGIRTLLEGAARPEGLKEETWAGFTRFVKEADDDELLEFVRHVEWVMRETPAPDMPARIKHKLTALHGVAADVTETVYQRLFLHIFKLLSARGLKRIDVADLEAQLTLAPLSQADETLLLKLRTDIAAFEQRITTLEGQVGALSQQSADIVSQQAQLFARQAEVETKVDFKLGSFSLDVPPLGAGVTRREQTVTHFAGLLGTATWCALYGGVGSGKTHLAMLIAEEHGSCRVWVRMRDLTADQACVRLDQAVAEFSGSPPRADWQGWCEDACAKLGAGALIVIDDLPRTSGGHLLASRLTTLARACAAHDVKLLTTSAYELPPAVRGAFGSGALVTESVPAFTDSEVRELFEVYGAPADFPFDRYLGFLGALGHRHPTLLAAVAHYLQSKGWVFTIAEFEALVTGRFAGDQNVETQMLFVATVQDEQSRNLLYRLNLANRPFTEAHVRRIGEVEPQVPMPIERVNAALGLWVQRDSADTYVLSPLLNQLGGGNLGRPTERGVHLVLGEEIVRRDRLGGFEVLQVIHHFTQAEAHNKAGSVLLSALVALQEEELTADTWAISEIWAGRLLSPEMNLDLRLAIRTSQVRARLQLGKSIDFVLGDLDALLSQAGDANAFSVMGATLLTAPVLSELGDTGRARRYLLRALRAKEHAILPDGSHFEFPPEVTPESLIWADLGKINSKAELLEWWDTFEQFTPEQVQVASRGMIAEYGCAVIAQRLVDLEARNAPAIEPDWDSVLRTLEDFSGRARRLNFELLWACTVSSRIIVLAKFKNDFEGALRLAREALAEASEDPRVSFVIRESVGQRLVRAERWDEGLVWLREALASPIEAYAIDRMHALIIASQATGISDPEGAIRLTEQAVQLAKESAEIPETDVVKALGEKAIALWLTGDLAGAFAPLVEAGERLFACKDDKPAWKVLLVVYGHVVGYLSYLHRFGKPPRPGGVEMPAPVRNVFLFDQPDALAQYDESKDCLVAGSLANFAMSVGDGERGAQWALRAFDMARDTGSPQTRLVTSSAALVHLTVADRYEDELDVSLSTGKIIVASEIEESKGRAIDTGFDPETTLGAKPSEEWSKAEAKAAMLGLVPVMFRLATIHLTDETQALAGAERVARTCREIARDASAPALWNAAADLFERVFAGEMSAEELRIKGKEHVEESPPVLHILCYVGISLLGSVQQAAGSQLAVLPYLSEVFGSSSPVYTQIIVPFIRSYWQHNMGESRFSFRNPSAVEEALSRAVAAPSEVSTQQILEVVASSAGVTPSEKAKAWLNTRREAVAENEE